MDKYLETFYKIEPNECCKDCLPILKKIENFELEEIEGRKNSIIVLKNFSKGNTLKSFIRFISGGNEYKKDNQGKEEENY